MVVGGIFCHCSLSAILRRKIGQPKEEIGNLNGFEYMYLSDLKVPMLVLILHIHKGYFHGHDKGRGGSYNGLKVFGDE